MSRLLARKITSDFASESQTREGRIVALRIDYPGGEGAMRIVHDHDIYMDGGENLQMWWREKHSERQQWLIRKADNGYYTIRAAIWERIPYGRRYLEGGHEGVHLRGWYNLEQQYWKIEDQGNGACSLQNKQNGKYLAASLKGMCMWHWENLWHQRWKIIDQKDLDYLEQ